MENGDKELLGLKGKNKPKPFITILQLFLSCWSSEINEVCMDYCCMNFSSKLVIPQKSEALCVC